MKRRSEDAAMKLHQHLVARHCKGGGLVGPDPGIRFNARIGRFLKSYSSFIPWSDDLAYMQTQGYWVLDNWLLFDRLNDPRYRELARECSDFILSRQHPDGHWSYPNPEWKGRVATVEGCFAAIGLLDSYSRLQHAPYLDGARRWYEFMVDRIGFVRQPDPGMLAINYFAHNEGENGGGVPNNSTLALWNVAKLAQATGDTTYLEHAGPLVAWLRHVQLESGELPYALGETPGDDRVHFLCFQYNAFQLVDLAHYYRLSGDSQILPVLEGLAEFVSGGLTEDGVARYNCERDTPEVLFYASAIARAMLVSAELGFGDCTPFATRALERVLSEQTEDGGFRFHSRHNYKCLTDRRSYPRIQSMVLNHLLHTL